MNICWISLDFLEEFEIFSWRTHLFMFFELQENKFTLIKRAIIVVGWVHFIFNVKPTFK